MQTPSDLTTEPREILIYCDGACAPNPGVGGWAAILISPGHGNHQREISGAEESSTNNRMELTAAVMALRALKWRCTVKITTDSQYVRKAFTEGWLEKWKRNGWRTSEKKPVTNADLWTTLSDLTQLHDVTWHWVKGHAEDELNNRCDQLAVQARAVLAAVIKKRS